MAKVRPSTVFSRLLDAVEEPVYLVAAKGQVAYVNSACLAWTAVQADDLLGQTCRYHSSPEAPPSSAMAAVLCPPPEAFAGQSVTITLSLPRADGTVSRRCGEAIPLTHADGSVRAVLVVLQPHDATAAEVDVNTADRDEAAKLHLALTQFREQQRGRWSLDRLVGDSPAMQRTRAQTRLAAETRASVLIVGAQGAHPDDVARAVHYAADPARQGPLVPLDCGLLDSDLLRSALRALSRRDSGTGERRPTLLLSDIQRCPASLQAEIAERVSADPPFRIIATSPEPLAALAARGEFQDRLAALLSTLVIELVPLSQRVSDVPLLAQRYLEEENARGEKQLRGFSTAAMDRLAAYSWPGDVLELAELVRRSHAQARGVEVAEGDLPGRLRFAADALAHPKRAEEPIDLERLLADIERRLVEQALNQAKGNKTRAAELLGLNRPRLYRRMVQLGLIEERDAELSAEPDDGPSPNDAASEDDGAPDFRPVADE